MSLAAPTISPLRRVSIFLDLIKFAHSMFALPFALIATFLASRAIGLSWPGWGRLGLILLCMVTARTYAMTVNRLVDRRFDKGNPRTAKRPSATGLVSPLFMVGAIVLCAGLFTFSTLLFYRYFQNPWPAILAIPVLMWLGLYSFTKRFTAFCHFWLGISLGLAPVSAWLAIVPPKQPILSLSVLLLGVAVLFWVAGFDIFYALQDEQIDREMKLNSIPAKLGRVRAIYLSRTCHALTIAALAGVGVAGQMHYLYWIGFALAAGLLVVEQALVSQRDISRVNLAFMTFNGLMGLVFGGLAIADVLVKF